MLSTAQLRGLSIGLHCLVCLSPSLPALAQSPPLLFQGLYSPNSGNTDLSSATDPGFNATPVLWHFDPMSNGIPSLRARNTYAWQARRTTINIPSAWRAFYAVQDAAVVAGGNPADAQDIANTLAWFSNQDATLDYVFDDFEGQGTAGDWSNIQNLVNQVRGSVAGANAGIGSYSKYYGSLDLSQPYPYQSDRRLDSRYYASGAANGASGLTVAMPACYPMQYLTNHADDTYSWGQSWWTQRTGFSQRRPDYAGAVDDLQPAGRDRCCLPIAQRARGHVLWSTREHFCCQTRSPCRTTAYPVDLGLSGITVIPCPSARGSTHSTG
ncbi:MAG: hypothetical protein WDM77_01760 [Steroidobacteraceae bacterium]